MLEGTKLHLTIQINVCKILQLWELIFAHFRCTRSAAFFSAVSADFHPMNLIITLKRKKLWKGLFNVKFVLVKM